MPALCAALARLHVTVCVPSCHVHRQHRDKRRTRENAEQAVKIIRRHLDPEAALSKLGQADYWRFRDSRVAEVSSTASANVTLRYLKAALNRAVRDGLIGGLPFRVEMLPDPPKRNRALASAQVTKVLKVAADRDPRAHAVLFLAYTLGLRLSEVLNLWWRDVDLEDGWLQVEAKPAIHALSRPWATGSVEAWSPKTRQRRVLVLDDGARKFLAEWRDRLRPGIRGPSDYVVPCDLRRGTPFTSRWAGTLLARMFTAAKVDGGAHALRHTMVTEALEAGVPIHVVQRMAGHSSVTTTLGHYAHVRDTAMREAAEVLAQKRMQRR